MVRVLVRLDEDAGDADGHRRARQHRHEAAVAAGRSPLPARLLHRMGRVEDHRAAGLGHDRQRAHVGDERVVAEARAALGEETFVAALDDLGDDVLHVPRRQELALLDVDRAAGSAAAISRSVCRLRNAGICRTSTTGGDCRTGRAHARRSGSARRVPCGGRRRSRAPCRGRAALALDAGAVGLVERGLVDEADAGLGRSSPSAARPCRRRARAISSWQGPAMSASGRSLPKVAVPTLTCGLGFMGRDYSGVNCEG